MKYKVKIEESVNSILLIMFVLVMVIIGFSCGLSNCSGNTNTSPIDTTKQVSVQNIK